MFWNRFWLNNHLVFSKIILLKHAQKYFRPKLTFMILTSVHPRLVLTSNSLYLSKCLQTNYSVVKEYQTSFFFMKRSNRNYRNMAQRPTIFYIRVVYNFLAIIVTFSLILQVWPNNFKKSIHYIYFFKSALRSVYHEEFLCPGRVGWAQGGILPISDHLQWPQVRRIKLGSIFSIFICFTGMGIMTFLSCCKWSWITIMLSKLHRRIFQHWSVSICNNFCTHGRGLASLPKCN